MELPCQWLQLIPLIYQFSHKRTVKLIVPYQNIFIYLLLYPFDHCKSLHLIIKNMMWTKYNIFLIQGLFKFRLKSIL